MRLLPGLAVMAVSAATALALTAPVDQIHDNEAATLEDIRTIMDAEVHYQGVNGGYFDRLDCLVTPKTCIFPYDGPATLLSRQLAEMANRSGYRRSFHLGPNPPDGTPMECSATSMLSYAFLAWPVEAGVTGVRSFCADSTGRICAFKDGVKPEVVEALCPEGARSSERRRGPR